jgi:hypothetical protein
MLGTMTSAFRTRSTRLAAPAVAAVLALTMAACGGGSDKSGDKSPDAQSTAGGSKLVAVWPLTGLPANTTAPNHPALAVKIPNTPEARPQVGMSQADLVYEELVEGGITRLGVVFYSKVPGEVGPVRSMRTSDIGIVKSAHAVVVGSGAAPPVLRALARSGVRFYTESGPGYFRVGNRVAPYNLLVHLKHLAAAVKKFTAPAAYFQWGKDTDFPGGRPATSISAHFSNYRTTQWKYEGGKYVNTNSYAPANDQYKPDTVIVVRVKEGVANYRDPAGNPVPVTLYRGKGNMLMFHGGQVVAGTWQMSGDDGQVTFSTAAGPLKVPAGHVFLELVPVKSHGGNVSFRK